MSLTEQQRLLWDTVTGRTPLQAAASAFRESVGFTALERLRVYRNMYVIRLGEALRKTFPGLEAALGSQAFRRVAIAYLKQHPSEDPRLEFVGRSLPAYLSRRADPALKSLAPVAALDWARNWAMLAPDPHSLLEVDQIDARRFAEQSPCLLPSLSLVWLDVGNAVAVWRGGFRSQERALQQDEAKALDAALRGASVAAICGLFQEAEAPLEEAYRVIASWFAHHWVTDLLDAQAGVTT